MPRRPLIRSQTLPYHVTNQANNREVYPLDLTEVWSLFVQVLFESCLIHGGRVHALVLMPNHFHLIITCPESDLGTLMGDFGTEFTKRHNRASNRCGHVFRGRYHWSLIESELYAAHAVRYVYRNPIRAGLCLNSNPLEYPFSTLQMKLGHSPAQLKLFPLNSMLVPQDPDDLCSWVTQSTPREEEELIRKGLKRARFKLGMERHSARRAALRPLTTNAVLK